MRLCDVVLTIKALETLCCNTEATHIRDMMMEG